MRYLQSPLSHLFIALSGLGLAMSAGCADLPDDQKSPAALLITGSRKARLSFPFSDDQK